MDRGSDSQGCHSHSWALTSPSVKYGGCAEQKARSEQSTEELVLQSDRHCAPGGAGGTSTYSLCLDFLIYKMGIKAPTPKVILRTQARDRFGRDSVKQ